MITDKDKAELDDFLLGPLDENGNRPGARIDRVTITFERKGKCKECTGSVERSKSFSGLTFEDCQEQAAIWSKAPLRHKRCE